MQNVQIQKSQGGFTLIELVIVIVILGILAAVAVPRFIDLSDEASQAAAEGVAGSLASGAAINYAAAMAGNSDAVNLTDCADADGVIEGTLDTKYTLNGDNSLSMGDSGACTVTDDNDGGTANFQIIGVTGQ